MSTPLGAVLPWWGGQFLNNNGEPLAAGKVYIYLAGTSTKTDSYSDSALTTPNANPVILDANGRATIFLGPVAYTIVVATSTAADPPVGAQIIRTIDGVSASSSLTNVSVPIVAGESITAGQWVYMSDGTGALTAGRWYLTDANVTYKSITAYLLGISNETLIAGESGTAMIQGRFELLSGTVVAGTQYYLGLTTGAITSTAPTNARNVAFADTTTSVVLSHWQRTTEATAAISGVVTTAAQSFGGLKTFSQTPVAFPGASTTAPRPLVQSLRSTYAAVGNVGAGEDDLMALAVDAAAFNSLSCLKVTAWGYTAANANAKQIRMKIGTTTIVASTSSVDYNNVPWMIEAYIGASGATTQSIMVHWICSGAATATLRSILTRTAGTEVVAAGFTVKCTGEATANDDIVQVGLTAHIVNAVIA